MYACMNICIHVCMNVCRSVYLSAESAGGQERPGHPINVQKNGQRADEVHQEEETL